MKTIFILLLFTSQLFSQQKIDSIINVSTRNLEIKGISEFFYFAKYCNGGVKILTKDRIDCTIEDGNVYLFWKERNKSFIRKLGLCNNTNIKIKNTVLNFYIKNLNYIKTEKVKRYQTSQNFFSTTDHTCFKKFYIYENSVSSKNEFIEYNTETDQNNPNINYISNNNLKIVMLAKLCEKIILQKKLY